MLLNWRVTMPPSSPVKVMSPWPRRTSGWMLTFVQDFRCFTRSLAQHGASLAFVFSGMVKSLVEAWDSDQIELNYIDYIDYIDYPIIFKESRVQKLNTYLCV